MGLHLIKIKALHESINIKGALSNIWENRRYALESVKKRRNVILLSSKVPNEKDIEWAKSEIKNLDIMQITRDVIVGGK